MISAPPRRRTAAILLGIWIVLALLGWGIGATIVAAGSRFDGGVVNALRATPHTTVLSLARDATFLGSPLWLNIVFFVVIALLLALRRFRSALFLVLASPVTVALHAVIVRLVDRARPLGPHLTPASGASFPSGHSMDSTGLYVGLVLILLGVLRPAPVGPPTAGRPRSPLGRGLLALVLVLLLAIGVSRVVLGVHYPSDVLIGWLISGTWLASLTHFAGGLTDSAPVRPVSTPGDPT
ncbi:MAG TPA: phosphatase PAP2 family protein [Solirubrobacteraceae bacterium]|nr:phosphatase PAP2 family protein [Solirubrobacteraceae bacterium]